MKEFKLNFEDADFELLARAMFLTEKSAEELIRVALKEYMEKTEKTGKAE